MKITTTPKVKQIKIKFPSRADRMQDRMHREERTTDVRVTGLQQHEHVLVLNSGEIKSLHNAALVMQQALSFATASTWEANALKHLADKLAALLAPAEEKKVEA